MSSTCIEKLPHSCGSSKGLQVFADDESGEVSGFCFSCLEYVHEPYGHPVTSADLPPGTKKSDEEIKDEISEVFSYKTIDLPSRKLRAVHLEAFGVKVSMSECDGQSPAATYFPITKKGELSGYYVKTLGKNSKQWSIGDVRGGEPFGWAQARRSGAYKLYITEGREDAVAVLSIFDRYGKEEYKPAIIALPNGVMSVKGSLGPISKEIMDTFKEIILVFDEDDAGREATKVASTLLPKAKTVTLPDKDPNDCIIKGSSKAAFKALSYNAAPPSNTRVIRSGPEAAAAARKPVPFGEFTWPFPSLNHDLRGMRTRETVYLGAGVKMGKSDVVDEIAAHLIKVHGIRVLMAKPEEYYETTLRKVYGKAVGSIFDDPAVPMDLEKYDEAVEVVGDKLDLIKVHQVADWDTLKADIIRQIVDGARAVFVDPITNLTAGLNAGEVNSKLAGMTRDLSTIAMDMNVMMFITAHLKSPDGIINPDTRAKKYEQGVYYGLGNCAHERGGSIYSNQFTGSRAMMQSCNLMFGLEGNRDKDLPKDIQNTRWLTILEDRTFGNSGSYEIYRNPDTTSYMEVI